MKTLFTLVLFCLFGFPLLAQYEELLTPSLSKHSISFDVLMQMPIYGDVTGAPSVNYEYAFLSRWRTRLGMGSSFHNDNLFIPFGLHYLTGQKAHHLDLSAGGYMLASWYERPEGRAFSTHVYPYVGVGYRYQKSDQAFFFKIQPVVLVPIPAPLLSLSLGWTF
ncbi:hypothetical protein WJR50_19665 [Catalinimonas sp. 4WD22]|uniref:hypothetical protein n=1 Tax=Catalinimonas locisalis TaxID=3133978 RepID=UPI0031010A4C